MKINIVNIDKTEDYREGCKDTLFVTSNREVADHLTSKGEAVCICVCDEEQLPAFEGYKYFITEGVQDIGHMEMVYCHTMNIPYVIAESEDLIIREETLEDLAKIYELYEDEDCQRFLEPLPEIPDGPSQDENTLTAASRFESVKNSYMFNGYGMWIIERKSDGAFLGRAGFEYVDDDTVSIGFAIVKNERKKGYAYAACLLCIDYLKDVRPELKVIAKCDPLNFASKALIEKLSLPLFKC